MDADKHSTQTARTSGNAIRTSAFIIYGTLFLLLVTIPGSVVNWLQGLDDNAVQQRALRVAETVQSVSDRTGLAVPYLRLRAVFLEQVRGE